MQSGLSDFEPEKIREREKQEEEDRKVMDLLGRFTAQMLKDDLRKDGHPKPEWGDGRTWRHYYLDECRRRGTKVLEDLGWPTDEDAIYVNIHTGCLSKLIDEVTDDGYYADRPDHTIAQQVWSIIEHWEPYDASKPNLFRIKYLEEEIQSLKDILQEGGAKEYLRRTRNDLKAKEAELERAKITGS